MAASTPARVTLNVARDINANGSGIIGYNINLHAGGDINGLIIGQRSVSIDSQRNVNVTAFSGGGVDINAVGSISGSAIGDSVSVSGDSISADLVSQNVSGDTSGKQGIGQSDVTPVVAQTADNAQSVASKNDINLSTDNRQPIRLAQKVGRVTVLLPGKK